MVIRMQAGSEKGQNSKAMKIAAAIDGVESVTLAGEGRNLLRVIGDGVDSNYLTSRLRRKVGHADIVELRTLQAGRGYHSHSAQAGGPRGDAVTTYGQFGSSYPAAASYSEYYSHQQQPSYGYYPPTPYYGGSTVEHHEYPAAGGDPNGCCIM